MKRLLLIMLPMLMLVVGCGHKAGAPAQSELYRHYAERQDLKVAQVDGFKLCDTVRVDVVMLQAESDEAWQQLKDEFGIADTTGTTSWLGHTEEPAQRVQWDGQPVLRVIASHVKRTIGFYRLNNEVQYDALVDYQIEKMKTGK